MTSPPFRDLARRFERRYLRPLLGRGSRQRTPAGIHDAVERIESRLELLERLLRESLGLQYVALRDAGDSQRRADDR